METTVAQELQSLRELIRQQSQQIARLETTLRTVLEIAMLPESERQARAQQHRHNRLMALRGQIEQVVAGGQFERLEPLILELQHNHAGDAEAEEIRLSAWARRDAAMADALQQLGPRVEAYMSVNQWQLAIDTVKAELVRFPEQPELKKLLARIHHEHNSRRETAVNRLYGQIRDAIDRREWRRALKDAEEMAGKFGDHPRGAKIIQQLATIRDNAEIEHRQEMERDLQQFIKSRRFSDAIQLAEDLIERYPLSPQAAECRALIPKLEEVALNDEADRLGT